MAKFIKFVFIFFLAVMVLLMIVMAAPLANAQVAVGSFTLSPEKVLPGSETNIVLTLENVGNVDIKNVVVTLDLSEVPFVPVGSSNEKIIDKINDRDEEKINFRIRALPEAPPSSYKIPVIISYEGSSSYEGASKTSLISVEVTADAHLELFLDKSELVKVNDHGKVTLKFVNDGLIKIKNLKITLKELPLYKINSPRTLYLGEVDVGDFETEDFVIIPLVKDPLLAVEVEYIDTANNPFQELKLLKIPVYTEEEAKQLGLVKNNSSKILFIILFILVFGAILLYRRRKKKKNAL